MSKDTLLRADAPRGSNDGNQRVSIVGVPSWMEIFIYGIREPKVETTIVMENKMKTTIAMEN